ncbi:MAG TPA: RNA methyltransferase [Acidimicrobiales bacterium]
MAEPVTVTSPLDPRLEAFTGLNDAAHRDRLERRLGVFVVEGVTAIERLLTSPYPVQSLLLSPAKHTRLAPLLAGVVIPVFVAEREVLARVAGFDLHRGALAVATRLPLPAPADLLRAAGCVVVGEGWNDHENLGAIARTATALGADGLLLDPASADPLYRRCVRVSMGEILRLPFTRLDPWPASLGLLREAGFTVVALTPATDALRIDELAPPGRVALLLGAEGPGLSGEARRAADVSVRIPMRAGVDSLNLGHAAAIALHRLARPC